jgi:cytoskeletal protein CcmA (bactofilin family)
MIQTQGTVTIGAKADVTSSKIACREAFIEGKLRGNLLCTGTAHVKWKGKIPGAIEARQLLVVKRSEVEFVRPVKVKSAEISGKVSANLHVDGTVKITKRGWLEGTVYARGIVVEKGGVFLGELIIGEPSFVQPELATAAEPYSPKTPVKTSKQPKVEPKTGQADLGLDL